MFSRATVRSRRYFLSPESADRQKCCQDSRIPVILHHSYSSNYLPTSCGLHVTNDLCSPRHLVIFSCTFSDEAPPPSSRTSCVTEPSPPRHVPSLAPSMLFSESLRRRFSPGGLLGLKQVSSGLASEEVRSGECLFDATLLNLASAHTSSTTARRGERDLVPLKLALLPVLCRCARITADIDGFAVRHRVIWMGKIVRFKTHSHTKTRIQNAPTPILSTTRLS